VPKDDAAKARLGLLGGFAIAGPDGRPIEITGRKTKALLAILAASPDFSTVRDRLIALLWSDRGDQQARNSLRQALVSLKRELSAHGLDILETDRDRVGLRADRVAVDASEFERLAAAGKVADAAALYRGRFLDGFAVRDAAFDAWVDGERRRLEERALQVYDDVLKSAPPGEQVGLARRLLAIDPLRESSHRLLMQALTAAGERDQALRQFEACRRMLKAEFGVEPETATLQLCEAIRGQSQVPGPAASQPETQHRPDDSPDDRTVIAVLPFTNLSGDAEQDYFAEGISEDLITELARYRHVRVIGHRTTAAYKDQARVITEIGRELRANFIIEGSVRLASDRVRVAVQLVDAETGTHEWADRFDRELADLLVVQDEITSAVVSRLTFNLDGAAAVQRQRDQTTSGTAYSHFLKARAAWQDGEEGFALDCLKRAIAIDPHYGRALAYAAYFYAYAEFSQAAGLQPEETYRLAREHIDRALSVARSDPFILHRAAMVFLLLGEPQAGLQFAEAAARANPRDAEISIVLGLCLACSGKPEQGVAMMERAIALEPRLPPSFHAALSDGRLILGDYAGSLAALDPIFDPPYYVRLCRVPNLVHIGRIDEARAIVAEAPTGFDPARFARSCARMCARPEDADRWLDGFRRGGIAV
jgi:TolB-like protein